MIKAHLLLNLRTPNPSPPPPPPKKKSNLKLIYIAWFFTLQLPIANLLLNIFKDSQKFEIVTCQIEIWSYYTIVFFIVP